MDTQSVPVLDLRRLESRATRAALDAACREWGFFQVINHGLDNAAIAALGREMLAFFRQPPRRKREILRTAGIDPTRDRTGPSWSEFIRSQSKAILATDFACVDNAFLRRFHVLFAPGRCIWRGSPPTQPAPGLPKPPET